MAFAMSTTDYDWPNMQTAPSWYRCLRTESSQYGWFARGGRWAERPPHCYGACDPRFRLNRKDQKQQQQRQYQPPPPPPRPPPPIYQPAQPRPMMEAENPLPSTDRNVRVYAKIPAMMLNNEGGMTLTLEPSAVQHIVNTVFHPASEEQQQQQQHHHHHHDNSNTHNHQHHQHNRGGYIVPSTDYKVCKPHQHFMPGCPQTAAPTPRQQYDNCAGPGVIDSVGANFSSEISRRAFECERSQYPGEQVERQSRPPLRASRVVSPTIGFNDPPSEFMQGPSVCCDSPDFRNPDRARYIPMNDYLRASVKNRMLLAARCKSAKL